MTTLQHVVFPVDAPEGADPLYVEAGSDWSVVDAHSAVLPARTSISFGTYFNAFPSGFWAAHTPVRRLSLVLQVVGAGVLTLHRSDQAGRATESGRHVFDGGSVTVPVTLAEEDGWHWFSISCETEVTIKAGRWLASAEPLREGSIVAGITTMNKTDFCVRTLRALSGRPEVSAVLERIVVVDQGSERVAGADGFAVARDRLGSLLMVIEQENLGGSGGFARSMLEALEHSAATGVMFLDDDVRIEADSILRAVRFAQYSATTSVVGGHMLDLRYSTVLHSWAEWVDPANAMWGTSVVDSERHDFADTPLTRTPWAHRQARTDYNGWWMCLIPREVIDRIGLPAPFFIKWDDAEYGLRAKGAGIPTVTLPGVALWHVSWLDKDDSVDWQAYFHSRNRVITALLHVSKHKSGLLRDLRRLHLKQLLSMEYYAVEVGTRALADVLRGPEVLHAALASTLPDLRRVSADFGEATVRATGRSRRTLGAREGLPEAGPQGRELLVTTARSVLRHILRPVSRRARDHPIRKLSREDARWWTLAREDSVLVESRDGTTQRWLRRSRRRFLQLWWRSLRLNVRLLWSWSALARRYRAALPAITSADRWRTTIGM